MGGPILADNFLQNRSPWGTEIDKGDQFWLPKLVRPDRFWQQKWSGVPLLAGFFCQNRSGRTDFGGTDFGVTGRHQ